MHSASVAELVDAVDSKSTVRKDLGVRVPPLVPLHALLAAAFAHGPDLSAMTVWHRPPITEKWHNRIMA